MRYTYFLGMRLNKLIFITRITIFSFKCLKNYKRLPIIIRRSYSKWTTSLISVYISDRDSSRTEGCRFFSCAVTPSIHRSSFIRLTPSFFRFCSRRILESTCCPRICIQGRRFTNATFARETTRNHFGQISRKNFAPICWKCTVTRFLRLATRTTTLSGFLKSIGARISSTSRINRVRSFVSPMERWKFTTARAS